MIYVNTKSRRKLPKRSHSLLVSNEALCVQSLMLPRFVGEEKYIGEVYGHGARAFGKAIGTDDDVYWCDLITGTLYEGLQSPSGLSLVGVPVKTDMTITIKDILPNGKRNV